MTIIKTLHHADQDKLSGLSTAEVMERLATEGYNELPAAKPRNLHAIVFEVLREPMFLLMLAAGLIYLTLGDVREALFLLASVFAIFGITIYQSRKTERALEALRNLTSPRAVVIRNGCRQRIAGRELVRGDILLLEEGDRVPADAVVLEAHDLKVDESLLTGESVAVQKLPWDGVTQITKPGGEDLPFVYSGTLIVQGQATVEVLRTGIRTEFGQIGAALQTLTPVTTRLQSETVYLVRRFAIFSILLCGLVLVIYGLMRADWIGGLLAGITLAMALLPEEFPVVLTIFLALGAWRISRQQVLTRHMPAIETLGETTVLCVDKTGTLTLNRMAVRELCVQGRNCEVVDTTPNPLASHYSELIRLGILASEQEPFDPMDKALHETGQRFLSDAAWYAGLELAREYPLTPECLAHTHVWRINQTDEYLIASKGAPEAIAKLCNLPADVFNDIKIQLNQMAEQGLRVLAVAQANYSGAVLPEQLTLFHFEFLGLIGFADPIRPTVAPALQECYNAGIRVVMITGDYPITAQAIARQIGLANPHQLLTGAELDQLSDIELQERISTIHIFARVRPEQKLRLVNAYKARDEIVAMTGDGVNDAPALKAAHIGVAMGTRGTDVAREAASLVLVDDDFSSMVDAIRLGRRIFDNIQNAMSYIVAVHIPTAGMALLPLLFGWPIVLYPAHIVFLEFIIDPACSIVFEAEAEQQNIMRRPPRKPKQKLLGIKTFAFSVLQGLTLLTATVLIYWLMLTQNADENTARAVAFTTIVLGNLALIFTNLARTESLLAKLKQPNAALWIIVAGALIALLLILYTPYLAGIFRFSALNGGHLLLSVGFAAAAFFGFELYKTGLRKMQKE